jgi:PadR family transcriptional regulator PadR
MTEKTNKETENTKAQMRKGILEFCILLVISNGKMYANSILKELKKADLLVVEGTLYPMLSRLKNSGMLEYSWEESRSGPPRKYYELTGKGKESLSQLTETWNHFSGSINSLIKKFSSRNKNS